jgi:metal-dependent amidase/aminoacylase/carboxypeptidase family protein
VDVTYFGKAAHASAMPYRGVNALDAVVSAYQSIAQLRQHIRQTERIHGIITEGGLAANIVPERAACRFYVRARDMHELAALKKRVQACFEAGALSTGCRLEMQWVSDYLDLKTNWPMANAFAKNFEALGRELTPLSSIPPGFAGSTDMGNVSHRVPSIHPMIGVAPAHVIIHNAEFARWAASDKGDAAVIDGAKSLAHTALDLMCEDGLMARVRADFIATAELSKSALAALTEKVPQNHTDLYAHAGCGCA